MVTEIIDNIEDNSNKATSQEESFDSRSMVPAESALPMHLTLMPLQSRPIFPGIILPIVISHKTDIEIIKHTKEEGGFIGFLLTKSQNTEITSLDQMHCVGTVAKIYKTIVQEDGSLNLFITSIKRFKPKEIVSTGMPLVASVEYLDEYLGTDMDEIKGMTRSIFMELRSLAQDSPFFTEQMRLEMFNIDQPGRMADLVTSILNADRTSQQDILETINIHDRLEKTLLLIKKEQELTRIQRRVSKEINERVEKIQRQHFLKEELKAIKEELGEETDPQKADYKRFQKAIQKLHFKGEIKEQVENELEKFSLLEPSSAEYSVCRNYLETIISLPWHRSSKSQLSLAESQQILDQDHYGLEDVKERITEYLAVRQLKPQVTGSILCLVGPPGVGKTSIGQSIARAMGRQFFRFSVGGMRDEAEIKGHRRTYVGSMPGKIIQGLKIVKTQNPVFMIDEIDKLNHNYQSDPSSALLEVLDPQQNATFRDHYLDLPFDLSHVVFIATANTTDTIPAPLLDRMEIIHISGYTDQEKVQIAKRYIIPKSLDAHGLTSYNVQYDDAAILAIANGYAREAGMRHFEKIIHRISRKVAKRVATGEAGTMPIVIQPHMLEEYLKKAPFHSEDQLKITRPGMTLGLAWTAYGGETLMIEAVALPSKKDSSLQLTGQLGEVMKESANIAYTYAQIIAQKHAPQTDFFDTHRIHLHIPEGATPKDGPSAGITMVTALVSLATGKKCPVGWAMTGELSLTGNVLPIGGLKEKSLAARRLGIKHIIIPQQNESDLQEIGAAVTEGITYHPVERVEEVLALMSLL